jgi:hypothetical protein
MKPTVFASAHGGTRIEILMSAKSEALHMRAKMKPTATVACLLAQARF